LEYNDILSSNATTIAPQTPPADLSLTNDDIITNIDLDVTISTPLEKSIAQSVIVRNGNLNELRKLTHRKRNYTLLMDGNENIEDLTEETSLLLTDVADLLTVLRHSTVEFCEAIIKWRRSHNKTFEPFLVNGKNYLATLSHSVDFLAKFTLLKRWMKIRLIRNPLVLMNGLDERLEGVRNWENLPPVMVGLKYNEERETHFEELVGERRKRQAEEEEKAAEENEENEGEEKVS